MMTYSCPCGFSYEGSDFSALDHEPEVWDGIKGCCNCGGQKCMSCAFREMHDNCKQDCPSCCN